MNFNVSCWKIHNIHNIYINGYINIKLLKPPFLSFLLVFSNFYAILCQVKKLPCKYNQRHHASTKTTGLNYDALQIITM